MILDGAYYSYTLTIIIYKGHNETVWHVNFWGVLIYVESRKIPSELIFSDSNHKLSLIQGHAWCCTNDVTVTACYNHL